MLERGTRGGQPYEVMEQDVKLGLLPAFTYCMKYEMTPYDRIDFRRTSGDLKNIVGSWRFVACEDGAKTLVVYQVNIDAGKLVPGPLMRSTLRKTLPDALRGMRDRVAEVAGEPTRVAAKTAISISSRGE